MLKHVRNLSIIAVVLLGIAAYVLTRPDEARLPLSAVTGVAPRITEPRPQTFPTVQIAEVGRWQTGQAPNVAAGLTISRYAEGLDHPRNLYRLPNGDVLVVESNAPKRPPQGFVDRVQKWLMGRAGAGVPSANRISLLRDADGDGRPELKSRFLEGLNSPFGVALVGNTLYVANTDAVLAFPYAPGATRISAPGRLVYRLSAQLPNNHWTRNLDASPDGTKLYIAVGSNSNIGENGMESERGRARVIEYDIARRKGITYASGLRNPVGLDWHPTTGELWTTVNERDMLGSDLVPDYLAKVEFAADYGWPHHYWGGYTDERVQPLKPEKRQYERRPDYALGTHVAPLGLLFARENPLAPRFASGGFVARHGSWNRVPPAGYDVVFVRFARGEPTGQPLPVATGFLHKGKARGRPTMLAFDRTGALLVSDDVGNIVWRISAARPTAPAAPAPAAR